MTRYLLLLLLCAATSGAGAQGTAKPAPPPPPAPAATAPPPVDANAVRRDLYDLGLLRALQSVNLDAEQIKTLRAVVKETLDADKARRQKDDDAVRELAADAKKAREGALAGDPIPAELEAKYVEMQKTVTARIGTAKRDAVEKILTLWYPTLTATQKNELDKLSIAFYGSRRIPATYRAKPKDAPREEILKLAAGAFVENVLLDDRMPALLETLKPLKTSDAAPAKP